MSTLELYSCKRCGAKFGIAGSSTGSPDDRAAEEHFDEQVAWHEAEQCSTPPAAPEPTPPTTGAARPAEPVGHYLMRRTRTFGRVRGDFDAVSRARYLTQPHGHRIEIEALAALRKDLQRLTELLDEDPRGPLYTTGDCVTPAAPPSPAS